MVAYEKRNLGNSLAVQWLGLHASTAGGTGSIPGRGNYMLHSERKRKEKKNLTLGTYIYILFKISKVFLATPRSLRDLSSPTRD